MGATAPKRNILGVNEAEKGRGRPFGQLLFTIQSNARTAYPQTHFVAGSSVRLRIVLVSLRGRSIRFEAANKGRCNRQ